ncbi:MAG: hypothetical protein Q4C53_04280 [Clostridia bacterium]|nr:hypothetical protein [Clostridia bacterium]
MPRTKRRFSDSGYYDAVLRPVAGERLFRNEADHAAFLACLRTAAPDAGVSVAAYCLLPCEARLLLHAPEGPAGFFKRLAVRYVGGYNRRHGRTGPLFSGRYVSVPLEDEQALLHAVCAIHTAPSAAGIAPDAEYPYSSYAAYARHETDWVANEQLLQLMNGARGFAALMLSYEEPPRETGEDAAALIRRVSGFGDPKEIASLGPARRDEIIRRIRRAGLSVRRIAGLTGLGRNIVQRAGA